jgi:hypothetical protein
MHFNPTFRHVAYISLRFEDRIVFIFSLSAIALSDPEDEDITIFQIETKFHGNSLFISAIHDV